MGKGLPVAALAIAEAPKEMADVATLNHFILPSRFLIFSLTFFNLFFLYNSFKSVSINAIFASSYPSNIQALTFTQVTLTSSLFNCCSTKFNNVDLPAPHNPKTPIVRGLFILSFAILEIS